MNLLIQQLVIILGFVSHKHEAIAQSPNTYTSLVVPVTKHTDTTKPLYSVRIMATDYMDTQSSYSNYLIDIDAPVIWHDCIPDWKTYPVPCHSEEETCMEVQPYSYKNPSCHPNNNRKIPALCLPSKSSAPGVLFTGTGPYYLLPQWNVDIRSLLSYTPLLNNPNSFGYFISIDAIVIKNRSIYIPAAATAKLSTTEPYTTLRTDIFSRVVRRFSMVTKRISTAMPIAPFGLCFRTSTNGTKVSLKVPNIYFSLQGGKTWTVSAANSIKEMTKDVACLALVDGGATNRCIWALESSGDFFVASVRKVIDDKSLPGVDSKTRWIKYVPIKVNVHAWKVKTDSLPTRFNVSRRGIHIDSIMCAICDKGAETSSHLFFSCCMARQTVRMITRWWDVPYGEVDSYEDWINWFVKLRLSYTHKQMLEVAAELEEEGGKYGVGQIRLNVVVTAEDTATSAPT
uniref:Basic 7S globulin 2-like n=1 Tax=Tanacetum cinerariifolium TaxID=118510 RepID=A0A6L2KKN5_TANCI|nr:basic 7S globulin 2-like [Tanacetum cinerariifolium]